MLKIAESNNKTSNNSIRLIAAALIINIAKLVATTFIVLVAATLFRLIALAIPIIAALLKCNACKAIRGYVASSAT